jgi:hypothetical protein
MLTNRRNALKTIGLTGLYALGASAVGLHAGCSKNPPAATNTILDNPPDGNYGLNIFLHGFFFFEIIGQNLVLATPFCDGHNFGYWDYTDSVLHPFPGPPIWDALMDGGQDPKVPQAILQFSRDDLRIPAFIPPPSGDIQYAFYQKLPRPSNIAPVRAGGNIREMKRKKGNVSDSLENHCGTDYNVSLITCLQYKTSRPLGSKYLSLYAEHCKEPDYKRLNAVFATAKKTFKDFDLELDAPSAGNPIPAGNKYTNALCELDTMLKNNPCPSCRTHLIRTANCPQFGIVQQ